MSEVMRFCRNNGLTIALLAFFLASIVGQYLAGWCDTNQEHRRHNEPGIALHEYLLDGEFWSATGENWESEFLQMFFFIWLTTFLFQKGSPESNDPDEPDVASPTVVRTGRSPWPVQKGGLVLKLYAHSLSLTFLLLFLLSFVIHVSGGARHYNEELARAGLPRLTTLQYLGTARMWFESFQNWQSEFLSVAAMVFLTVYLRERGSPESKQVESPHEAHE